jgi:SAM-dependent methyltransferase
MAFGSSTGDELVPVSSRVGEVTLVDSSDSVLAADAARVVRATKEGIIKSRSEIFSLVTCLGVLHHVPNVTYVFSELVRVLEPGGYLLLREPIVSMGDWRLPRPGLTSRERGIPLGQLEKLIGVHGLTVCSRTLCGFPLTPALTGLLNSNAEVNGIYLSRWRTGVDFFLSRLFKWNVNYHPKKRLDYLRPRNVAYVLRKDVVLEGVRR